MNEPQGMQSPIESKNLKIVLVITAIAIALIAVVGAVYFLYFDGPSKTPTDITLFDANSVDFLPSEGTVFSLESPYSERPFTQYTLFGRVLREPELNQETGEFSFLAEFPSGEGRIVGDVILGVVDESISVSYVRADQTDTDDFTYNRVKVSDITPFIISGGIVYVTFAPINTIPEYYINSSICDEGCIQRLTRSVELYEGTNRLIKAVDAGNSISETIIVGPASQLVLYSN